MGLYSFSKSERISGTKRIDKLFREGESGFAYPFRYLFLQAAPESGETAAGTAGVSILVSVSKRYHKRANKRNLIKRRTREAYRLQKTELSAKAGQAGTKVDIALIYSIKEILDYNVIKDAVGKIINKISEGI